MQRRTAVQKVIADLSSCARLDHVSGQVAHLNLQVQEVGMPVCVFGTAKSRYVIHVNGKVDFAC